MGKPIYYGKVSYTKRIRVKDKYEDFSETFDSMWIDGADTFRIYPSREMIEKRHIKILESKEIGKTSKRKNE